MKLKAQLTPLLLTVATAFGLCVVLYLFLTFLNLFPIKQHIQLALRPVDILVGMTIYLKTSIDFAILIGNLMRTNPGWKKRIAIEIGTALGNALGTLLVLTIWFFFKEVPILMVIMIFIAALVLLKMAEEGFAEFLHQPRFREITKLVTLINKSLYKFNRVFAPFISKVLPQMGITKTQSLPFCQLLILSFTVPFIFGLDDFAGYIPLFNIINVFSFCVGVFLAHMALNIALFASPKKTTAIVNHPAIILIGSCAFVGIAVWGMFEAVEIIIHMFL